MLSYTDMEEHSSGGSALFGFWRGWRREIRRGAVTFAVVVVAGFTGFHFFRSFASGWSDLDMSSADFARHRERGWHEAFRFSEALAPGERVWIRNRTGAVIIAAAEGESLLVVAEKSWRRSSPEMVEVVRVPHEGGVTFCALWEAKFSACRARGMYEIRDARRNDVMVRFTVHVPRGVEVDASTVNGVLEIGGVRGATVASTVNGKIRAEVSRAPFRASTVNGSIEAEVTLPPAAKTGEVVFETVNGSITAALPLRSNAELEASTVHGRIESDFPVSVSGKLTSRRLSGRLGAGGPTLRLSTVNGSVRVTELEPAGADQAPPEAPGPARAPRPPGPPRTRVKS